MKLFLLFQQAAVKLVQPFETHGLAVPRMLCVVMEKKKDAYLLRFC